VTIYRTPLPAISIPDTSVAEFVLARASDRGNRAALVDAVTGRTIRYSELPGLVDSAAGGFSRLGLRKGDVCAIFSQNTPEYAIAVLALARIGAVVTTASPVLTRGDLEKQLADCRARCLITSPALRDTALAVAAGSPNVEHVLSFGDMSGAQPFAALLDSHDAAPDAVVRPADLFALPYSSGTTGLPKGVMLSHRNVVANMLQLDASRHLRDGQDTLVCFLPFFHIYGLTVIMLLGLWAGATLVVMPRFDLEQYLDLVERHRATMLHVVPPIVLALAKNPAVNGRDFSSVRKLFSGAAPLGPDLIAQCTARLGCALQQGYGMTEASPATHTTDEYVPPDKRGSVGVVLPNTECRVVDPVTLRDVTPGADGEIWIRGPQVMLGYYNRPEETKNTIDDEGWLHTGDIGHADSDGWFYIVDRLKELIKYKAMQVAPAELESVLLSHPSVADAAVVPLPDEEAGEIPLGFVVLKAPASPEELIAFVAERVAPFKKVRRIEFIDAIPKSPSGKILRRVLRGRAAAASP
jgi:acyl-CoA synthetase (AMP-forming)/AMP-acid ligase II